MEPPDRAASAIAFFTMVALGIGLYGATAAWAVPVGGPSPNPRHTVPPPFLPPSWSASRGYRAGDTVTHDGLVYGCVQAHSSPGDGEPPAAPALWRPLG